jgi:cytochrome d ubiquinol oxidase subunit I
LGWFVTEHGRQPWAIAGVLPTFLAVSPIPASSVALSLAGFVVFYSVLAAMEVFLLKKYIAIGPGTEAAGRADAVVAPGLVPFGSRP